MTEEVGADSDRVAWRVHPAAERRGVAVWVAALILVLGTLVGAWMGSAYWGAFAFAVLFLSLEAFFLPASYELDDEGVTVRKPFSRVQRPWSAFRRVVFDPAGVTLSPFRTRRWLEPYRAVRLRFSVSPRVADATAGEVRRFLLAHLDPQEVRFIGVVVDGLGEEDAGGRRARAVDAEAARGAEQKAGPGTAHEAEPGAEREGR